MSKIRELTLNFDCDHTLDNSPIICALKVFLYLFYEVGTTVLVTFYPSGTPITKDPSNVAKYLLFFARQSLYVRCYRGDINIFIYGLVGSYMYFRGRQQGFRIQIGIV